jgi:putative transposase
MCALAGVSRASSYRFRPSPPKPDHDLELRDAMQRIAVEFPSYGWPRMTEELQQRGWAVNHKRVYRLMREDNLLCLRRRKFVVTTNSDHGLPVYSNRARDMVLTGLDQLWVADITYIRLLLEFVYLAVILDAFSRREIGWALERNLEDTLTLGALRMAIARRRPAPGLVHHSDRGVQYASRDYTDLLRENGIQISMSRQSLRQRQMRIVHEDVEIRGGLSAGISRSGGGSCFHRTLPGEGLQRKAAALRARLSSARCIRTLAPVSGRRSDADRFTSSRGYTMSFLRHEEIYRPMRSVPGRPHPDRPRPHRFDEFPASYSLAGCAPALPASASPAEAHREAGRSGCTIEKQRTAGSVLTTCLTQGDNPMTLFIL